MSEPCRDCRLWKTSQTGNGLYSCNKMMGAGNLNADIMFVGDWPGDDELKNKLPLSGMMGQLLKRAALSVGITPEQSYYTHLCKCKPSFDAPPSKVEMNACSKYLIEEIVKVRPKVIVACGANVASTLGAKGGITQIHGQVSDFEVEFPEGKFAVKVLPVYHPAYVNNFVEQAKQRKEFYHDLGKALRIAKGEPEAPTQEVDYRVAKTIADVKEICAHLIGAEWLTYDCETTGLDFFRDKILLVSFSDGPGKGYVIPYEYPGSWTAEELAIVKQEISGVLAGPSKKIMQNGRFDIQFLFANKIPIKMFAFDTCLAHYLLDENSRHGLDSIVPTYTDMGSYKDDIAKYFRGKEKVLAEGFTRAVDAKGEEIFRDSTGEEVSATKAHRVATILDCPYDKFVKYAAQDADATFRLYKAFWPLLEQENLLKLLVQIVTPLSYVLATMEFAGIKGDLNYVQTTSAQFKRELDALRNSIANSPQVKKYLEKYNNGKKITKTPIKKLGFDGENVLSYLKNKKWLTEEGIVVEAFDGLNPDFKVKFPATDEQYENLEDLLYESTGQFNTNSPLQKTRLLFDIMGLIPLKINRVTDKQRLLGKTQGNPSTDAEALEMLLAQNKIKLLEDIIAYAKIKKFQDYMLSYEELLLASPDGRIHTSYSQHTTKTGRLSSSRPNLQNIPKHDEKRAKLIRTTFIAREGYSLVEADYSQIEFRLWGHCSGDEILLASLNDQSADIHYQVASRVFRIPVEKVTEEQRSTAKSVVYGLMYGMSNYSLAQQHGMEEVEVNRFVNGFFSTFPKAANWMEENVTKMEQLGHLTNWVGRRRRATDIYSKVKAEKESAQRQSRNFPLQSGAADLSYMAMIRIYRMLQAYGDDARMLLQIHDSLIFEVKDSLVSELLPKIKDGMETAAVMKCSIATSVEVGKTLGNMKKVRLTDGVVEILAGKNEDGTKIWEAAEVYNVDKERSLHGTHN